MAVIVTYLVLRRLLGIIELKVHGAHSAAKFNHSLLYVTPLVSGPFIKVQTLCIK